MNQAEIIRAHDAIFDACINDGEKAEIAEAHADEVVRLLEIDVEAELVREQQILEQQRAGRKAQRREKIVDNTIITIIVLICLAALALFSYEMYAIAGHGNKDYAGYGPKRVPIHATAAFHSYYGDSQMPSTIHMIRQTRAYVDGHKAWQTEIRGADKVACVYVWDGDVNIYRDDGAGAYKVVPGACTF